MSDLSNLFLPPPAGPAQPAQFRQAVLLEFDADNAANTVQIGQTNVPNLPLLVNGAEIGLEAGDIILVMYLGNTPLIVGKIATPGSANYGAANASHFSVEKNGASFGAGPAGVVIATATIPIPGWANSARIIVFGVASMHNTSASLDNFSTMVAADDLVSGSHANSPTCGSAVTAGFLGTSTTALCHVITCTPGDVLTFTHSAHANGTWSVDSTGSISSMFAVADFFRESAS